VVEVREIRRALADKWDLACMDLETGLEMMTGLIVHTGASLIAEITILDGNLPLFADFFRYYWEIKHRCGFRTMGTRQKAWFLSVFWLLFQYISA